MIKALLVEDEAPIRNGIARHVPWKELGVDEIRTAENAEVALELGGIAMPDIIISDIRMPGMLGTELCSAYRDMAPDCQIIFMSGYSDKEYLTAAIHLGAVSYIEKPIDMEELCEAVRKAVRNIRRLRTASRSSLHTLIYAQEDSRAEDRAAAGEVYARILSQAGPEQDRHHLVLRIRSKEKIRDIHLLAQYVIRELSAEYTEDLFDSLADVSDDGSYTVLLSSTRYWTGEMQESAAQTLLSLGTENSRWFISMSGDITRMNEIPAAYRTACAGETALSWKGWNSWVKAGIASREYSGRIPQERLSAFSSFITDRNEHGAREIVDEFYTMLVRDQAALSFSVRNGFYALDHEIVQAGRLLQLTGGGQEQEDTSFLDEAQTIMAMRDYVKDHLHRVLSETEEHKGNYAVRTVCEYVLSHLQEEDLTAGVLADVVYLTPAYLSALFRRTMGTTLVQFITDTRMKQACQLLTDPQLKLYQISDMVGYSDAKYFARQFKKTIGMTPSEYRERL